MKKKISFIAAAVVCAVLLFYGVSAFADAGASHASATSHTVSGTLSSISTDHSSLSIKVGADEQSIPLAKDVWVFRNDQKAALADLLPGDQVEVVLNSKKQAAYIKAASAAPSATPAPTVAPTPTPTATPVPTVAPTANPTSTPGQPGPHATAYPGLENLNLMIVGPHFKLEIKRNEGNGGVYELNLKPSKGGVVHLKGDEAAGIIKDLLSGIDLNAPDAGTHLLAVVGGHYGIDTSKLQVKLNVQPQAKASVDLNAIKADDQAKVEKQDANGQQEQHETEADDQNKAGKPDAEEQSIRKAPNAAPSIHVELKKHEDDNNQGQDQEHGHGHGHANKAEKDD